MARRSDHSRTELASLVRSAARALAEQDGLRGITMRAIAARIGYSAGSIYNAVGDLDTVLLHVKADTLTLLATHLDTALQAPHTNPMQRALNVAEAYIDFVTQNRRLWIVMLEHRPPEGTPLPDWFSEALARPIETVDHVLAPFFPSPPSCRRATTALWAALEGVASLAVSGNLTVPDRNATPTELARSLVQRYLTGREGDGEGKKGEGLRPLDPRQGPSPWTSII